MEEKAVINNSAGRISESRTILSKYYSVQFSFNDTDLAYLFKLRDIHLNGLCILVKEDSSVFKQLKVGDTLNMEYNPQESSGLTKILKTQITSKNSHDRFKGHSLVGLSIIKDNGGRREEIDRRQLSV